MRQTGFENQLTELPVSLSLGPVNGSCQITLSAIGILAEEDLGPPGPTPTSFEVTTHGVNHKPGLNSFPLHSHFGGENANCKRESL